MGKRCDWFIASGAAQLRDSSPVTYEEYVCRIREANSDVLPVHFEDDWSQINLDVDRIGPSIGEFLQQKVCGMDQYHDDNDQVNMYANKIRDILAAYSVRNSRVGYIQGHADVMCFILANTTTPYNEEEAFWIYAIIVERIFPNDFFARDPKLHGFQVDVQLLSDLITDRLVPSFPRLAEVDLSLLTSLLACKWFISLWVGMLPHEMLVQVWDAMLCDSIRGPYIHFVCALRVIQSTTQKLKTIPDAAHWDASYLYKAALDQCSTFTIPYGNRSVNLLECLKMYNDDNIKLTNENLEDMRANVRSQSHFQEGEAKALMQRVHFRPRELYELHCEFMFIRVQCSQCTNRRGLHLPFVEGLLAVKVPWFPSFCMRRLAELTLPDVDGNVRFYNLIQLLSVVCHGTIKERASLLFAVADRKGCNVLNSQHIETLADILCAIALRQVMTKNGSTALSLEELSHPHHSPFLRSYYVDLLHQISGETLKHKDWIREVQKNRELGLLMEGWYNLIEEKDRLSRYYMKLTSIRNRSTALFSSKAPSTATELNYVFEGVIKSCGLQQDKIDVISTAIPESTSSISLLSSHMKRRYNKERRKERRGLKSMENKMSVDPSQSAWCQCTIS